MGFSHIHLVEANTNCNLEPYSYMCYDDNKLLILEGTDFCVEFASSITSIHRVQHGVN